MFRPEYNYRMISDRRVKSNHSPLFNLYLIPSPHPPSLPLFPSFLPIPSPLTPFSPSHLSPSSLLILPTRLPQANAVPRGGLVANNYVLRDLDGSLLGKPSLAVAPFSPILPPANVINTLCTFQQTMSAYQCAGVCYRTFAVTYNEVGVSPMPGAPANVLRPYR